MSNEVLSSDEGDSGTDDVATPQSKQNYSPTLSSDSSKNSTSKRGTKFPVRRANHNELERKRRYHQKIKLNELRDIIPGLQADKLSTVSIIQKAKEYILALRCINAEQAQMIAFLRKKNPGMMLPGPAMLPPGVNMAAMMGGGDPNMNNMSMMNPAMYSLPMNSMPINHMNPMLVANPIAMNAMFKNQAIEMEKMRRESERNARQRETASGEQKLESPTGQPSSQRSSGSDGIPPLPTNDVDWNSRASLDTSIMAFDHNMMYPRKRRSIIEQDFDTMVKTSHERRDSFAAMFEPTARHSEQNPTIPMNYRENMAALYNYGFYNPEDKGSIP
jgi:hypothetical protein